MKIIDHFVPPNGHIDVLEIGCNKGFICNALKEYYTSGNVVGVDLSPNDIAFAKEHFPGIDFFAKMHLIYWATINLI